MSEPTREHVEAVARVLMQPRMFTNMSGDKQRYDAAAILTSTDPAVWDAIAAHIPMDALVRTGRLRAQVLRERCSCGTAGFSHAMAPEHHPLPNQHRYVTEWTEAPDA